MGMAAILGPGEKGSSEYSPTATCAGRWERKPDVARAQNHRCHERSPHTIAPHKLAAEALELMERHKINQMLVATETGELVGARQHARPVSPKVIDCATTCWSECGGCA